jgi:hypothetical protein
MVLIICPECDHQISDRAATCPNCGYPLHLSDVSPPLLPTRKEPPAPSDSRTCPGNSPEASRLDSTITNPEPVGPSAPRPAVAASSSPVPPQPAAPQQASWFCKINGTESGPFSSGDLRQMALAGKLSRADSVRKGAGGPWVTASRIKGLAFPSQSASSPGIVPADVRTASTPVATLLSEQRWPECSESIEKRMPTCPHCGYPLRAETAPGINEQEATSCNNSTTLGHSPPTHGAVFTDDQPLIPGAIEKAGDDSTREADTTQAEGEQKADNHGSMKDLYQLLRIVFVILVVCFGAKNRLGRQPPHPPPGYTPYRTRSSIHSLPPTFGTSRNLATQESSPTSGSATNGILSSVHPRSSTTFTGDTTAAATATYWINTVYHLETLDFGASQPDRCTVGEMLQQFRDALTRAREASTQGVDPELVQMVHGHAREWQGTIGELIGRSPKAALEQSVEEAQAKGRSFLQDDQVLKDDPVARASYEFGMWIVEIAERQFQETIAMQVRLAERYKGQQFPLPDEEETGNGL